MRSRSHVRSLFGVFGVFLVLALITSAGSGFGDSSHGLLVRANHEPTEELVAQAIKIFAIELGLRLPFTKIVLCHTLALTLSAVEKYEQTHRECQCDPSLLSTHRIQPGSSQEDGDAFQYPILVNQEA